MIGIIPCSKEKIWDIRPESGAVLARHAYRSSFHRLARGYVEGNCDGWLILSAKYGFLAPDDVIEGPYDVSFTRPQDSFISDSELREQALGLGMPKKIISLCPRAYAQKIELAFSPETLGEHPLRGVGGWGAMHTWLRVNA